MTIPDKKSIPEKKNDSLKNKFQMAEITAGEDLKFKISEESFNSLKNETQKSKNKSVAWGKILIRFSQLLLYTIKDFSRFFMNNVLIKGANKIKKHSVLFSLKMREKLDKKEIEINNFLNEAEEKIKKPIALISQDENLNKIELSPEAEIENFERKVIKIFNPITCHPNIDTDFLEMMNSKKSIDFTLEVLNTISSLLLEGNLITNVDILTLTTTVEKKVITTVLDFELRLSGNVWSTIFSKYVSLAVNNMIINYNGTVEGFHQRNFTKDKEIFTLVFQHKKIEIEIAKNTMNELESRMSRIESCL